MMLHASDELGHQIVGSNVAAASVPDAPSEGAHAGSAPTAVACPYDNASADTQQTTLLDHRTSVLDPIHVTDRSADALACGLHPSATDMHLVQLSDHRFWH